MQDIDERDLGLQPLDKMMGEWGIDNHQLVEVSTEQLTHKQVQKARKGRRLTLKMMQKVTRAFNVAIWGQLSDEQKEAYYEYSVGVGNIFKVFRIDFNFRGNYLDPITNPDARKFGVTGSFGFYF